ncbi:EAL domain-containing protein [Lutimaribacter sp. EGI FJ00015]|uniref:EAL domain-containing protein n=1 Tax=Lutimaribacter degradans TaxID=2945989 RepID=A0ACC5ZTT7_9RHOB|nr:EAL domain-containing protein [Lutimaribacter sp. EGI FJ00013]MCM2561540.1 EAL domain-containing protein [Lutimaribacter sp. EGI FJ00013]MCO0612749.1 EAL domain-containing protein [Lutimaribacter sp. EGI FJ00015]MCO0635407.1 EAL domain-containing protein [Lutimaribacter sp. EGI FJ00014]
MPRGVDKTWADLPPGATNPLDMAVQARDSEAIWMVADALRHKEVLLAFQPVVASGAPGRVAFYEGLMRVLDAGGRVIPARDFIGAVEETETGRIMDCVALEMGLRTLERVPALRLSINMSARSIGYPRWMKTLKRGLERNPTVAERLILEITERSAMMVPELVVSFMSDLQRKGISFALDDFGAGYTSFRYLRDFYFDILKIDGQYTRGINQNADNQVLFKALVAIGQQFDMFTVAESVENQADALWLARAGVDCQQGYYHGAPTVSPAWAARPRRAAG